VNTAKKFLLPLGLGFVGMFIAHIVIVVGFGVGIRFPIYFVAYPVVYVFIAMILTWGNSKLWLSH